jgi:hypothetical protein
MCGTDVGDAWRAGLKGAWWTAFLLGIPGAALQFWWWVRLATAAVHTE